MVSLKQYNTQSRTLEILKRCSSNLASGRYITKEKQNDTCPAVVNSYAAGPVLIETKIPRFYPKQGSSTHNNLMGKLRQHGNPERPVLK